MEEAQSQFEERAPHNGGEPEIKERVRHAQEWAREAVDKTRSSFENCVASHPWQAAGIAAVSGFALSRLTLGAVRNHSYPRNFRRAGLEGFLASAIRLLQSAGGRAAGAGGIRDATDKFAERIGGDVRDFTKSARKRVEGARSYVSDQTAGEIAEDLGGLVRRHPIPSVLIGLGVGYLLSRRRF